MAPKGSRISNRVIWKIKWLKHQGRNLRQIQEIMRADYSVHLSVSSIQERIYDLSRAKSAQGETHVQKAR
jgi:hypothetical protein